MEHPSIWTVPQIQEKLVAECLGLIGLCFLFQPFDDADSGLHISNLHSTDTESNLSNGSNSTLGTQKDLVEVISSDIEALSKLAVSSN